MKIWHLGVPKFRNAVSINHKSVIIREVPGFFDSNTLLFSAYVETAKANDLRVYDYLEFLLSELAEHAEDTNREFLQDLLLWSPVVQDKCKNRKKT